MNVFRSRPFWIVVVLLMIVLASGFVWHLSAMKAGNPMASTSPSNGSASPSPSATPSYTPAPYSTPTPTVAAIPYCVQSQLAFSVGQAQNAAGSIYTPLALKNTGSASCVLDGFPGVSLLDNGGAQIGQPATRDSSVSATSVTIAPGYFAHATLHTTNPGNYGPGVCSSPSATVRIYPPNFTASYTAPLSVSYCGANTVTITPISAGASD